MSCKVVFTVVLTLHAYLYFCLLLKAYHPHWTFKHMLTGLEATLVGARPAWTRSCAACCRWPCFSRGVGLDDPQRSLPTPTILWFCALLMRGEPREMVSSWVRLSFFSSWHERGRKQGHLAVDSLPNPFPNDSKGWSGDNRLQMKSAVRRLGKPCFPVEGFAVGKPIPGQVAPTVLTA